MTDSEAAIQVRIYALQDEALRMGMEQKIYTALGKSAEALAMTRQKELMTLTDILRPAQNYLYALEDEASMKAKLVSARDKESAAITKTITGLQASIKTLNDYETALKGGDKSVLTPAQKYAANKLQAQQVAAVAAGSATTDAEIAARDAAISKLPSVSDAFLASSREMFASSEQYSQDFASVLDMVTGTSAILSSQQTDAEKQLEQLTTSTGFLDVIANNTETTATLLSQYLTLVGATEVARAASSASGSLASATAIPAFANGGIASGLAVVGDAGPELINFATPSRVYSNKASNDMFNTKELVAEIRLLRTEVATLRKEQKEQTGHLIATNYDANSKAATKVADATEEASSTSNWSNRSAVKIA
jgi:hypothetical protein